MFGSKVKEDPQETVAVLISVLRKDKRGNQGFLVRTDLEVKEVSS